MRCVTGREARQPASERQAAAVGASRRSEVLWDAAQPPARRLASSGGRFWGRGRLSAKSAPVCRGGATGPYIRPGTLKRNRWRLQRSTYASPDQDRRLADQTGASTGAVSSATPKISIDGTAAAAGRPNARAWLPLGLWWRATCTPDFPPAQPAIPSSHCENGEAPTEAGLWISGGWRRARCWCFEPVAPPGYLAIPNSHPVPGWSRAQFSRPTAAHRSVLSGTSFKRPRLCHWLSSLS